MPIALVVTSEIGEKRIQFDTPKLGETLRVPATEFDVYVRKDKIVLGQARLLELSQKLSQQTGL